jgi:TonB family protein
MHRIPFQIVPRSIHRGSIRLFKAFALACVIALAMHAAAADTRAVKSRVAPVYPEIAKRLKIAGIVMVEAIVDPEGKVADAKAISGNRMLAPAAEDAVRKWKFAPAAAKSTEEVEINFALAQ